MREPPRARVDVVTFEVLRHRLWEINDEIGLTMGRISGAPSVYESGDFNTAILTADGRGLFAGVYVIRQASALDLVVQAVLERFGEDIHEGDIFLTSDPWYGALHAMDSAVVAPLFWDGECVAWTGVVIHELDMGGSRPGSWCVGARDAYQEVPLMPPVKIVDAGRVRKDVESAFLRNSRTPEINALNLRAKIAAQMTTHDQLRDVIRQYGKETFLALQEQVLEYVRDAVRRRIAALPDGVWHATALLDHDGVENRIYRLRLALTKRGDHLTFDFTGTDGQAPGAINCAWSGLVGGILQVLFPLLCFDLPWSHGAVSECITIVSEPGTINNATFPAGTSMATVNACQATGNLVWEAMARLYGCSTALQAEVMALGYGGVCMSVWGGRRVDGRPFVNMFTDSVGGGGARSFRDGIDTCGNMIAPAYGIPNVERIESLIPVLYVYRRERAETAGAGMYRGGVGLEYMIVPHEAPAPLEAVFFATGASHMETKGVFGGLPGSVQRNLVLRGAGVRDAFARGHIPLSVEEAGYRTLVVAEAKDAVWIERDDAWVNFCTGGGGYGDPLDRDPARVAVDVGRSLCTGDEARRLYGVVLGEGRSVDARATEALRDELRAARLARGVRLGEDWTTPAGSDGQDRLRIGPTLVLRDTSLGPVFGCARCGRAFGPASEGPRRRALLVEVPLSALSPLNAWGLEREVVVREYCCPGCGAMFSSDVHLRTEDPASPEIELRL
jgi:N-methylhydantoinase B